MSTVAVRWHDTDNVELLVDGRQVLTVSNLDEDGQRDGPEPSVAFAAQVTADAVARALGAEVTVERLGR